MQGERSLFGPKAGLLWLGIAGITYGLVLLSGLLGVATGVSVRGVALAALGAALVVYTNGRLGPVAAGVRLGGRAQQAQRQYRMLVVGSAVVLYLVVVFGALMTDTGAIWACLTLPLCSNTGSLATLAVGHRILAALATLLIAVLAYQTYRHRSERPLRLAAVGALSLMVLGNAVGIIQVLLAQGGSIAESMPVRLSHVGISAAAWGGLVVLATMAFRPPVAALPRQPKAAASERPSLLKDYISLTKPGVISLLIFTTFAAMFITPAGVPSWGLVGWTMLGGWLMAAGSHALNCYWDRDIDIKMGRTGRRPLPSNRIPAWHALVLGIALAVVAFTILTYFVNLLSAVLALAGFFYYVVIYTIVLKRWSPTNIVIGGGAGAIPPLVGWAAVTGNLSLGALALFAIIFLWTPPHFWALALVRRQDYANAGVPMLPVVAGETETKRQIVVYSWQLCALSLILTPLHVMGWPYFVMALALGAVFVSDALRLQRTGTTGDTWRLYRYSLLYLFLLFAAMIVDRLVFA